MRTSRWPFFFAGLLLTAATASSALAAGVPSPDEFVGRPVGADRFLVRYPDVVEYMRAVAAGSERVSVESVGRSTLDNEMVVVVLTSAANQQRLPRYREIARQLANPDSLAPSETNALLDEGKVIALITCTIHSTEVGSTQMAMEFVHEIATTDDPATLDRLDDVILVLMPSINPDGQIMVVDWYERYLDTEFEGGRMPWLYQTYVGHDNNRDYYMLTQAETRVVNDVLYHRWFPQVFLDEHQMGSTGPRMFVPPQTDPLAPEVHSLIFRQADMLGTNMSLRLEEAGKTGVGNNMIFDSYWPGGTRNTAWWKNVTGLLTEVASARIATPIRIEPGELEGGRKGLPEYGRRANYPSPWTGGWWRLRDIMDYELIATRSLLESCSLHRRDILSNFLTMSREAIERGRHEPPYAFLIPPEQHDTVAAATLIDLLARHGVRLETARSPVTVGLRSFPPGTVVVPAAQPYRAFLLTMLRPQRYPEVLPYTNGPVIPPYDVTSWSLPISMGVDVVEADVPLRGDVEPLTGAAWPSAAGGEPTGGWLIPHAADSVFKLTNRLLADDRPVYWLREAPDGGREGDVWVPEGALAPDAMRELAAELHVPALPLAAAPKGPAWRARPVRVGLYKPWVASMDEGWTRWLLEHYGFDHVSVSNEELRAGKWRKKLDVLLLPDLNQTIIEKGEPEDERRRRFFAPLPPEYAGGLGKEGGELIEAWVREDGGTLVALDSSAAYAIKLLSLPVTDVLAGDAGKKVVCPGSMLRVRIDTSHPLGYGMRAEEAAYFAGSPAFRTRPPDARFGRRIVAAYPDDERDILLSGYLDGAEQLERRAAVVDVTVGSGRVVLIGFRAQHRAQPHRTFKLLFNALYVGKLEAVAID